MAARVRDRMATMTEVERKYDVAADFTVPDLGQVPAVAAVDEPTEYRLDATYYDTADLRLATNHVTLRPRTGGHDAGLPRKPPAPGGAPPEARRPPPRPPAPGHRRSGRGLARQAAGRRRRPHGVARAAHRYRGRGTAGGGGDGARPDRRGPPRTGGARTHPPGRAAVAGRRRYRAGAARGR